MKTPVCKTSYGFHISQWSVSELVGLTVATGILPRWAKGVGGHCLRCTSLTTLALRSSIYRWLCDNVGIVPASLVSEEGWGCIRSLPYVQKSISCPGSSPAYDGSNQLGITARKPIRNVPQQVVNDSPPAFGAFGSSTRRATSTSFRLVTPVALCITASRGVRLWVGVMASATDLFHPTLISLVYVVK